MGKLFGDNLISLNPLKNFEAHRKLISGDDDKEAPPPVPAASLEPPKILRAPGGNARKQAVSGISLKGN